MNREKLIETLAKSVKDVLIAQSQSVIEGMLLLKADMTDRIFLNGLDLDGSPIGKYSTSPMYASLNQSSQVRSSSLKGRGKEAKKGQRNQGKFKNGNSRKSMYLPGGYSEFRSVVGRQNSKVDLNLTGSLRGDIRIGERDDVVELAFTTDKQLAIAEGNEARFGNKTIFSASPIEIETLVLNWEEVVSAAFFKSFQ